MKNEAQKCPVCNGSSQYSSPDNDSTFCPMGITCHECNGTGWVTVEQPMCLPDYTLRA